MRVGGRKKEDEGSTIRVVFFWYEEVYLRMKIREWGVENKGRRMIA